MRLARRQRLLLNQVQRALICLAAICWICQTGCQGTVSSPDTPTRYEGAEAPQISRLIKSGSLKIDGITAVAEKFDKAEPFGEVIAISIKNESDQSQAFRI